MSMDMNDLNDSTDDHEALDIDSGDVQITRWIDLSPVEREEQAEAAKLEREQYNSDNYIGDKVAKSRGVLGWVQERRMEAPLTWEQKHLPQLRAFIERHVQGMEALSEPYARLAALRGDSEPEVRALIALAYAMGNEGGEFAALKEAEAGEAA